MTTDEAFAKLSEKNYFSIQRSHGAPVLVVVILPSGQAVYGFDPDFTVAAAKALGQ